MMILDMNRLPIARALYGYENIVRTFTPLGRTKFYDPDAGWLLADLSALRDHIIMPRPSYESDQFVCPMFAPILLVDIGTSLVIYPTEETEAFVVCKSEMYKPGDIYVVEVPRQAGYF